LGERIALGGAIDETYERVDADGDPPNLDFCLPRPYFLCLRKTKYTKPSAGTVGSGTSDPSEGALESIAPKCDARALKSSAFMIPSLLKSPAGQFCPVWLKSRRGS